MGAPPIDWEDFDPVHIDKKLSEKGTFDNYRVLFWQSSEGAYTPRRIVIYAAGKGWKFVGAKEQDSSDMILYHKAYRAIADTFFKSRPENKSAPQWFNGTGVLYEFRYFLQVPNSRKVKLFQSEVLVSSDESKMCVYPLLDGS